jgi:hypothetical protein
MTPSSPDPCAVYQTRPSGAGATSCGRDPGGTEYSRKTVRSVGVVGFGVGDASGVESVGVTTAGDAGVVEPQAAAPTRRATANTRDGTRTNTLHRVCHRDGARPSAAPLRHRWLGDVSKRRLSHATHRRKSEGAKVDFATGELRAPLAG